MKQNYILRKVVLGFLLVFGLAVSTNTAYGQLKKELNIYQTPIEDKAKEMLQRQIIWADFNSDVTNFDRVDGKKALKVGTVLKLKPTKGYVITATVIAMKPFQATDIYKQRILKRYPELNDAFIESYRPKMQRWIELTNKLYDTRAKVNGNNTVMLSDAEKEEHKRLLRELPESIRAYATYNPNMKNSDGDGKNGAMTITGKVVDILT